MLDTVGVTVTVHSSLQGSSTILVTVTVGSVTTFVMPGRVMVAFWKAVVVRIEAGRVIGTIDGTGMVVGTVVGTGILIVVGMGIREGISRVVVVLRYVVVVSVEAGRVVGTVTATVVGIGIEVRISRVMVSFS